MSPACILQESVLNSRRRGQLLQETHRLCVSIKFEQLMVLFLTEGGTANVKNIIQMLQVDGSIDAQIGPSPFGIHSEFHITVTVPF